MAPLAVHPSRLIDLVHYAQESDTTFDDQIQAYEHFKTSGQGAGLNPSPFFYTRWYTWQNPDATQHPSALDHFLHRGASAPLDPAPFIDSVGALRATPQTSIVEMYLALVEGRSKSVNPSLATNLARLHAAQDAVHSAISAKILRNEPTEKKRLVWIQAGTSFKPARWFKPQGARQWDLLCNWYTLSCIDLRFGEIQIRQSGTKFTGINHVLNQYPEIFERYDQILFLDDDLIIDHDDVDPVFDAAATHNLDMFQPSVATGSQCVWPDLFEKRDGDVRPVSGCEVMMFGFSKRALRLCTPLFSRSVSGFGLDLRCSEAVRAKGWTCGVVDRVSVDHLEVIDEKSGTYYEFMRALGINQKFELFEAIRDHNRLPTFCDLRSADCHSRGHSPGF
ncbi:hypothetical protein SLT36_30050 (plasmid) [Aminobacter sp. BA135]|uniref:hypothetical protein n=1 Tax=Aminobacter sp. BA135 TaxID=537596 RepID=UPI003D7BCAF0